MRVYKRPRRSPLTRIASKALPSLALVLVGSGGLYLAMNWFRHDAEEAVVHAEVTTAVTSEVAPEPIALAPKSALVAPVTKTQEKVAPLLSVYDGQRTGQVQRYAGERSDDLVVLAFLPGLDLAANEYHVWLVKDGLADVKDMGALTPRVDGSWVLNFTAGPATGIADPVQYQAFVIMREPNDDDPSPSGHRIAEAKFE